MFPFLIPILGAGVGAMANKKNPLKGALLGGALGAGGAGFMGGSLFGGAASTAAPIVEQGVAMNAAGQAGLAAGAPIVEQGVAMDAVGRAGLASPSSYRGLLDTAGRAAGTAASVKALTQQPPATQAPAFSSGGGNGSMSGMYQNMQSQRMAQRQYEDQMRQMRRGLIG